MVPGDEHLGAAAIVHPARELGDEAGVGRQELPTEERVARQHAGRVDGEAEAKKDGQREQTHEAPARGLWPDRGGHAEELSGRAPL